jgi:hypothetical protein
MQCTSPPELDERQLLASIDGEAEAQVAAHLAQCPYCRQRAEALARLQSGLSARLFRLACPTPLELGDYQLGLLSTGRAAAVAGHLRECRHCTGELEQLRDYLADLVPQPRTGPLGEIKLLIATLIGGNKGESQQPGGFGLNHANAALRGDAQGPILLEAEGLLITLDIQPSGEGQARLLGQIAAQEQDLWTGARVELRRGEALEGTAVVDDLGAFHFDRLLPGSIDLQILSGRGYVIQAKVEIVL